MDALIRGLHHVTATVNDAQEDLDFYAGVLGQRLVKKTVNFDNHHVYHFYYGNETGTPGTIMTTFPYKGMGVRIGTKGAGQITVTDFSVPAGGLDFWRRRLTELGVGFDDEGLPFGEEALRIRDPSGLELRLVGHPHDARAAWTSASLGPDRAIRGLSAVSLLVRDPLKTVALLTEMLDGTVVNESADTIRVGISSDTPGHLVDVVRASDAPEAVNGLGTVHHVAFAVVDADEQLRIRAELVRRGHRVTEVLDRQYFRSIYFREPNGVLFEIATIPPGFTADETVSDLGRSLKLPPWEEPHRAEIEAGLPSLRPE